MKKKLFSGPIDYRRFIGLLLLFFTANVFAQTGARITEVVPNTDQVTLTNFNATELNVTDYWLCLGPGNYDTVGSLNGGNAVIPAGGTLQLTFNVDPVADGLSLFLTNDFGSSDPDVLLDFVQWGAPNQPRSSQAVTAGRWDDATDFINCSGTYTTETGGSVAAWISSIVYAPDISFDGGETSTSICVDGIADPLNVNIEPGAVGTNGGWIITDQATDEILALPPAPPFNLDGAGVGVCDIWYIRYEDGLSGNEVGSNINELEGCFSLSNYIEVIREEPDGGTVSLENGETEASICAGDGIPSPLTVTHTTVAVNLTYRYVITDSDADNTILAITPSSEIDLDGAGPGICRIWGWSYRGLNQDDFIGLPLADLQAADCSDISDEFIEVTRLTGADCDILSVGEFQNDFQFALFPNPANNSVSISYLGGQSVSAQVAVYDIAGRLVINSELNTQSEISLDLSSLVGGTYLVQIQDNETGSNTTKQLIKE